MGSGGIIKLYISGWQNVQFVKEHLRHGIMFRSASQLSSVCIYMYNVHNNNQINHRKKVFQIETSMQDFNP